MRHPCKLALVLAVGAAFVSSAHAAPPAVSNNIAPSETATLVVGLYYSSLATPRFDEEIKEAAARWGWGVEALDAPPGPTPGGVLRFGPVDIDKIAPPAGDRARFDERSFEVSDEELDRLYAAKKALVISLRYPTSEHPLMHRRFDELVQRLVTTNPFSVAIDLISGMVLGKRALERRLEKPDDAANRVSFELRKLRENKWLVSSGLSAYGLPELVLHDPSHPLSRLLLRVVAQTFIERLPRADGKLLIVPNTLLSKAAGERAEKLTRPGAEGKATVQLRLDPKSPEGPLVYVDFDDAAPQRKVIEQLFGAQ